MTIKQPRLVFFCSELGCFLWGEEVKGGEDFRGLVPARRPQLSREAGTGLCLEDFFRFELGGDRAFRVL